MPLTVRSISSLGRVYGTPLLEQCAWGRSMLRPHRWSETGLLMLAKDARVSNGVFEMIQDRQQHGFLHQRRYSSTLAVSTCQVVLAEYGLKPISSLMASIH